VNLKAWVLEHRGELIAALLTLARAWYAAGRPKSALKPLGSYEAWSVIVGGILEYVGQTGFLGNADELYREADSESLQWEAFLTTLDEVFYGEAFTVAKIVAKLKETTLSGQRSDSASKLREAVPDYIAEGLDRDGFIQKRVGLSFARRIDQRFGKSQVHLKKGTMANGIQQWRVVLPSNGKEEDPG
jgi:predicted DNA-binding ribbon-helix-helix protein